MKKKCIFVLVVKLFFGNRSFSLLILPLLLAGYYLCNFYMDFHSSHATSNFGMWGTLTTPNHWSFHAASVLLVFISSLLLNTIFNRNEFMERSSHLTPILFITFSSFFHFFYFLEGLSFAQLFLVLTIYQLFKLNQNEDGRRAVFSAGFFFGIACTFYPVLFITLPFLFWMVWLMRPFIFRESALLVAGFIIPLIYSGAYSFVFKTTLDKVQFSSSSPGHNALNILVCCSGILLLIAFSLKGLFGKISVSSIRMKKHFRLIFLFIIMCVLAILFDFLAFHKVEAGGLIIISLGLILPYGFGQKTQKPIPTFIYYLVFFFSVSKFFIPYEAITF